MSRNKLRDVIHGRPEYYDINYLVLKTLGDMVTEISCAGLQDESNILIKILK